MGNSLPSALTFNNGVGLLQLLPELLEGGRSGVPTTDVPVRVLGHAQYLLLYFLTGATRSAGLLLSGAWLTACPVV